MTKFVDLIPPMGLDMVTSSGEDFIKEVGKDVINNVVFSVLCGDNIRNITEEVTRKRILLTNASTFITYLKAFSSFENLSEKLTSIIAQELKTRLTADQKTYLLWFVGMTGKGIQNVIREHEYFNNYLTYLDKNLSGISENIQKQFGEMEFKVSNEGIDYLLKWPDLLRCMLAIGSQTLTIRGSAKSTYGKLYEKFILGSVLTLLGFKYINKKDTQNHGVFWLSERRTKRESDATALLKPGAGIRFDIGFIGSGNTEISLDKVSRFEKIMERNGVKHNITTIIIVDKIGSRSRIVEMAKDIDGHIIQMSGTYWVHDLASTIKKAFPFYKNPLLRMKKEKSLDYLKEEFKKIDISVFLSSPQLTKDTLTKSRKLRKKS